MNKATASLCLCCHNERSPIGIKDLVSRSLARAVPVQMLRRAPEQQIVLAYDTTYHRYCNIAWVIVGGCSVFIIFWPGRNELRERYNTIHVIFTSAYKYTYRGTSRSVEKFNMYS